MAKKDKNTRPEFIKLVYFDEISATDLVYFKFGGSLNEQNDVSKEQSNEMQVDGTVSGNIGSRFFSFFNVKAGVELKDNFNRIDEKLVKQVVTNTVVTDYLSLYNQEDYNKAIHVFKSLRLKLIQILWLSLS